MELKFHKVATLPGTLDANAIYMVANGSYAETYVTDQSAVAKAMGNSAMINALIAAQLASVNSAKVVADIAARNALAPSSVVIAYVKNATADATVASGGATYVYDTTASAWTKIAEFESMDVVLSWSNITGKPNSTPGNIDLAVTNSHTHANKATLDLISAAGGVAQYNGDAIKNWNTLNW